MVDDRNPVLENLLLQPFPSRRVEDFAGAEHPFQVSVIGLEQGRIPIFHQHSHRGRRSKDAGDPELLNRCPPIRFRSRVIERALKGDGSGADDQRRVDNVAMTYDPADIGGRPPHIGGPERKEPFAHAMDVNLIATVGVDRQLRSRGGAGSG